MLKLTRKIEYGLIALNHMQNSKSPKELHSAKEIAIKYSLPKETLAKILQQMVKYEFVHAVKGASGGYYLDKSINKINLMEFIEKIEGPLGLVDCYVDSECSLIDLCSIRKPINSINNNVRRLFKNILLSELLK